MSNNNVAKETEHSSSPVAVGLDISNLTRFGPDECNRLGGYSNMVPEADGEYFRVDEVRALLSTQTKGSSHAQGGEKSSVKSKSIDHDAFWVLIAHCRDAQPGAEYIATRNRLVDYVNSWAGVTGSSSRLHDLDAASRAALIAKSKMDWPAGFRAASDEALNQFISATIAATHNQFEHGIETLNEAVCSMLIMEAKAKFVTDFENTPYKAMDRLITAVIRLLSNNS